MNGNMENQQIKEGFMMARVLKIFLTVITLFLVLIILAAGIYNFTYAMRCRRYQTALAEEYRASRQAEVGSREICEEPDLLFLPAEKQTEQLEIGMTLREVISLLGKPQRQEGSGLLIFQWNLLFGRELYVTFLPQDEGEFFVDSLSVIDFKVK